MEFKSQGSWFKAQGLYFFSGGVGVGFGILCCLDGGEEACRIANQICEDELEARAVELCQHVQRLRLEFQVQGSGFRVQGLVFGV